MALERAQAARKEQSQRLATVHQEETDAAERLRREATQSVAVIGEAYQPLRRQFGDIPPISKPLRAAKRYLAGEQYELAMTSAQTSWKALKTFRQRVRSVSQTYSVVRGDTLWHIARMYSPVRQGPGWVTIWKANKDLVGDFNRIEVGMNLKIPQKRSQYVMPFWKPR